LVLAGQLSAQLPRAMLFDIPSFWRSATGYLQVSGLYWHVWLHNCAD
jgi:hypothetical protein